MDNEDIGMVAVILCFVLMFGIFMYGITYIKKEQNEKINKLQDVIVRLNGGEYVKTIDGGSVFVLKKEKE